MLGKVHSEKFNPDLAQSGAQAQASPPGEISSRPAARGKRICIVGLGSISHNPRVVKEADALAAAGHDVVVVFLRHYRWSRPIDCQIIERAKWRAEIVDVAPSGSGRLRRWASALQLHLFLRLCRWTLRFPVAELAYSRYFLALLRRAVRQRSDLYIGHYTGSLPVVAWAARRTGAKFAFDFEDFHRAETSGSDAGGSSNRLVAVLEDRYLPAASFVTAASWGIGEYVAKTTGLPVPTTILNVFPWADRAGIPAPQARPANSPLSLYWFSQVVSLDRGLQDVIAAMALMRAPAELHIRGSDAGAAIDALQGLARERGVVDRVRFHPIVAPGELLADAAKHDIGLGLELRTPLNRDICITNKIFLYMLAGLGVVASRTRGHDDVIKLCPDAGFLYPSGDAAALAAILDGLAQDRQLLERTKSAALAAARDRWNWERESRSLIARIEASMSGECSNAARGETN
ncbi:MAG: glycosyltransferase [Xanthobacteraceae bacterium]